MPLTQDLNGKSLKEAQASAAAYKHSWYQKHKERLEGLKEGQAPTILLISCSDSRIMPGLITDAKPGDIFGIQNAGNIIPAYGDDSIGYAATLEYAVRVLGVKDIIVCGHESCGAMGALLTPQNITPFFQIQTWLEHAPRAKDIVKYSTQKETLARLVEQNTLHQIENIKSYPWVQEKVEKGELKLHAWVHHFSTGQTDQYIPEKDKFVPIN